MTDHANDPALGKGDTLSVACFALTSIAIDFIVCAHRNTGAPGNGANEFDLSFSRRETDMVKPLLQGRSP